MMQTIKIIRNESSTKPCEGVFWIIANTLIAFAEPMDLETSDFLSSWDATDPISYLSYEHCWNYIKKISLNHIITKHDCNFYPRGKVTVLQDDKGNYLATIHCDRILTDESYYDFVNDLPNIYKITKSNNCEIQYLYG